MNDSDCLIKRRGKRHASKPRKLGTGAIALYSYSHFSRMRYSFPVPWVSQLRLLVYWVGFAVGASWSAELEVGTNCVIGRNQLDVAGGGITWVDLNVRARGSLPSVFLPHRTVGRTISRGPDVRRLSRVLVRSQRNDGSKEYPDWRSTQSSWCSQSSWLRG